MRRRKFIAGLGGAVVMTASPMAASAQLGRRMRRLGVLSAFAEHDAENKVRITNFLTRLQSLGWRAGENVIVEYRYAFGDAGRIQAAVKEIVALAPEVILTMSNPVLAALIRETRTVPIVFAQVADPVGSGFVASLAVPGGNVTGFTNLEPSMGGKWLEVLKEAAPGVSRALALHHPNIAANVSFVRTAEAAGGNLGVTVIPAGVTSTSEIEQAVMRFAGEPHGGLIAMPNPVTVGARFLIAELATRYRLPAIAAFRYMAAAGTLLSYGNDGHELFTRAAEYVDRILRGARAGDLPIQAPTKFELVINFKTAKALGLTMPPTLLARADEVIE